MERAGLPPGWDASEAFISASGNEMLPKQVNRSSDFSVDFGPFA